MCAFHKWAETCVTRGWVVRFGIGGRGWDRWEGLGQVGEVERWSAWSFIQRLVISPKSFFGRRGQIKAIYFAILEGWFCFLDLECCSAAQGSFDTCEVPPPLPSLCW